jgi:hypothetical protein
MAGLINLFSRDFFVAAGKFDFQILADVYGADPRVAHVRQGALHRFALGINDGLFRRNNDFRFHLVQNIRRPVRGRQESRLSTVAGLGRELANVRRTHSCGRFAAPCQKSTSDCDLLWRGQQNKVAAAVLLVGRFIVARVHRPVFAIADGIHPRRIDAQANQLLA